MGPLPWSSSIDPGLRLWDVASLEHVAERFADVSRFGTLVYFMALAALTSCHAGIYALMFSRA